MAKLNLDEVVENGSVKIMLSYDYCHFEIQLGKREEATLGEIDELRKKAQMLADKAVKQFKSSKKIAAALAEAYDMDALERKVGHILERPKSEWSYSDKAYVKTLRDYEYWASRDGYHYEDEDDDYDWEDGQDEC